MAAASGTTEGGTTKKSATKASGAGTKAKKPAARRKKPASKPSGASSNQATYSAARVAQMELAGRRSAAAARLADPLWYRVEDVLPATTEETAMAIPAARVLPEQVQIVEAALSNSNLTRADVTPQAFCVLLEQARRYAHEIIADAQDYAVFAGRSEIGKADFELASQMRPDHPVSITTQLPKLNLLAKQINRIPLPPIPTQCYSGVLLPPKRHQLTARTFDVVSGAQVYQKMVQKAPSLATKKGTGLSSKSVPKPSYGAGRGRQIAINLKDQEPEKKTTEIASSSTPGGPAPMDISSPAPAPTSSTTGLPAATAAATLTAAAPVSTASSSSTVPTAVPSSHGPDSHGPNALAPAATVGASTAGLPVATPSAPVAPTPTPVTAPAAVPTAAASAPITTPSFEGAAPAGGALAAADKAPPSTGAPLPTQP